jgi:polyhydroxyalkanoate synthesis regulator phasin
LESPKGRQERLQYVKDMLKSYQGESERFPSIERNLKKGIAELMKPANPSKIKELNNKIRNLERKLWVENPLMGFFVSRMQQNS